MSAPARIGLALVLLLGAALFVAALVWPEPKETEPRAPEAKTGPASPDAPSARAGLLDSHETCRECHLPKAGARSGCVECHRYHDKSQERDPSGPFKVQQLRTNVGPAGEDRLR